MAKSIVVERDGITSSFAFSKIDRAKLYGRRRRIALDPAGQPCARASLTDDGSMLLRQGMTAQGYFTSEGHWIPVGDLQGLDAEGNPLEKADSTLGVAVDLEGPIPPQEVLDTRIESVYGLVPETVDEGLTTSLLDGQIFRLPFNFRPGWKTGLAFLVANTDGELFALVGSPAPSVWCEPTRLPETDDEDDDLDDELDFEMF